MNVGTKHCGHQIAMSTPSEGEAGATGEWRTTRPALARARCLAVRQDDLVCQLCWVYCPDVCIQQGVPPAVNLQYCKGCGICAEVCPVNAIQMVPDDGAADEAEPAAKSDPAAMAGNQGAENGAAQEDKLSTGSRPTGTEGEATRSCSRGGVR